MGSEAETMTEQSVDAFHTSPRQYVVIAAVLAVVTSLEIALSYLDDDLDSGLVIALLLVMTVVKFALVASWYMHLRTDRLLYRRVFVLGALAAVVLYAIVLMTFQVFD